MHSFDISKLIYSSRLPILVILFGLVITASGFLITRAALPQTKVEVLGDTAENISGHLLTVEISGAVKFAGVYKLPPDSRVDDLINLSGGLTASADGVWTQKYLNRAGKILDGQKIYIPLIDEHSVNSSAKESTSYQNISTEKQSDSIHLININTSSLDQLDSLPGIGRVFGQNIIDHRPYSDVQELVSKGVLSQNLLNQIKELISVY